ncbi:hypothetical protein [Allorhizocola rhizosphaerae]|uniref:hypothetical protein n=1 Tax=Allorhizocola rhizosphaerae TaxID=1872709 RepID=UPI0013C2A6A2|nr:hypothetical protein [Allorhizocola rhizosphaerae]
MRILHSARAFGVSLAAIVLAVPAPAQAAEEQVLCQLMEVITWDPPLKNEAQRVSFTATGQLTGCNGKSATGTYFESGTYANISCNRLVGSGAGTRIWDWTATDVESSVFSYVIVVERVLGSYVATANGPITAGEYLDSTARSVGVAPAPDVLACANEGVSRMVAVGSVTIGA